MCRSKSGGAHLLLFTERLGLPTKTEIFPKQVVAGGPKSSNWLNMPYFRGDETNRCGVRADGSAMTLAEFVRFADLRLQNADWLTQLIDREAPGDKAKETAYASGIYSSRRIARAAVERADFMMIVAGKSPDLASAALSQRSTSALSSASRFLMRA